MRGVAFAAVMAVGTAGCVAGDDTREHEQAIDDFVSEVGDSLESDRIGGGIPSGTYVRFVGWTDYEKLDDPVSGCHPQPYVTHVLESKDLQHTFYATKVSGQDVIAGTGLAQAYAESHARDGTEVERSGLVYAETCNRATGANCNWAHSGYYFYLGEGGPIAPENGTYPRLQLSPTHGAEALALDVVRDSEVVNTPAFGWTCSLGSFYRVTNEVCAGGGSKRITRAAYECSRVDVAGDQCRSTSWLSGSLEIIEADRCPDTPPVD